MNTVTSVPVQGCAGGLIFKPAVCPAPALVVQMPPIACVKTGAC